MRNNIAKSIRCKFCGSVCYERRREGFCDEICRDDYSVMNRGNLQVREQYRKKRENFIIGELSKFGFNNLNTFIKNQTELELTTLYNKIFYLKQKQYKDKLKEFKNQLKQLKKIKPLKPFSKEKWEKYMKRVVEKNEREDMKNGHFPCVYNPNLVLVIKNSYSLSNKSRKRKS